MKAGSVKSPSRTSKRKATPVPGVEQPEASMSITSKDEGVTPNLEWFSPMSVISAAPVTLLEFDEEPLTISPYIHLRILLSHYRVEILYVVLCLAAGMLGGFIGVHF